MFAPYSSPITRVALPHLGTLDRRSTHMIVFTIITVGKSTWHAQEGDAEGVILQTNKEKSALAPTKRRKRRSTEENMDRIIRAAADEFKASGFTGATTAVIARNAEVTEAQLFRYFASKAELFRESVFKPLNRHFLHFLSTQLSDAAEAETRGEKSRRYIGE